MFGGLFNRQKKDDVGNLAPRSDDDDISQASRSVFPWLNKQPGPMTPNTLDASVAKFNFSTDDLDFSPPINVLDEEEEEWRNKANALLGDNYSSKQQQTQQQTNVPTQTQTKTVINRKKRVLMLLTNAPKDRFQKMQQGRALAMLREDGVLVEVVDDTDPRAKDLMRISGIQREFPQVFLEDPDGKRMFFGGFDMMEGMHEVGMLGPALGAEPVFEKKVEEPVQAETMVKRISESDESDEEEMTLPLSSERQSQTETLPEGNDSETDLQPEYAKYSYGSSHSGSPTLGDTYESHRHPTESDHGLSNNESLSPSPDGSDGAFRFQRRVRSPSPPLPEEDENPVAFRFQRKTERSALLTSVHGEDHSDQPISSTHRLSSGLDPSHHSIGSFCEELEETKQAQVIQEEDENDAYSVASPDSDPGSNRDRDYSPGFPSEKYQHAGTQSPQTSLQRNWHLASPKSHPSRASSPTDNTDGGSAHDDYRMESSPQRRGSENSYQASNHDRDTNAQDYVRRDYNNSDDDDYYSEDEEDMPKPESFASRASRKSVPGAPPPKVLLLISNDGKRWQIRKQERSKDFLEEFNLDYEIIDDDSSRRDELLNISLLRRQYPQFFIQEADGSISFFGTYESLEELPDALKPIEEDDYEEPIRDHDDDDDDYNSLERHDEHSPYNKEEDDYDKTESPENSSRGSRGNDSEDDRVPKERWSVPQHNDGDQLDEDRLKNNSTRPRRKQSLKGELSPRLPRRRGSMRSGGHYSDEEEDEEGWQDVDDVTDEGYLSEARITKDSVGKATSESDSDEETDHGRMVEEMNMHNQLKNQDNVEQEGERLAAPTEEELGDLGTSSIVYHENSNVKEARLPIFDDDSSASLPSSKSRDVVDLLERANVKGEGLKGLRHDDSEIALVSAKELVERASRMSLVEDDLSMNEDDARAVQEDELSTNDEEVRSNKTPEHPVDAANRRISNQIQDFEDELDRSRQLYQLANDSFEFSNQDETRLPREQLSKADWKEPKKQDQDKWLAKPFTRPIDDDDNMVFDEDNDRGGREGPQDMLLSVPWREEDQNSVSKLSTRSDDYSHSTKRSGVSSRSKQTKNSVDDAVSRSSKRSEKLSLSSRRPGDDESSMSHHSNGKSRSVSQTTDPHLTPTSAQSSRRSEVSKFSKQASILSEQSKSMKKAVSRDLSPHSKRSQLSRTDDSHVSRSSKRSTPSHMSSLIPGEQSLRSKQGTRRESSPESKQSECSYDDRSRLSFSSRQSKPRQTSRHLREQSSRSEHSQGMHEGTKKLYSELSTNEKKSHNDETHESIRSRNSAPSEAGSKRSEISHNKLKGVSERSRASDHTRKSKYSNRSTRSYRGDDDEDSDYFPGRDDESTAVSMSSDAINEQIRKLEAELMAEKRRLSELKDSASTDVSDGYELEEEEIGFDEASELVEDDADSTDLDAMIKELEAQLERERLYESESNCEELLDDDDADDLVDTEELSVELGSVRHFDRESVISNSSSRGVEEHGSKSKRSVEKSVEAFTKRDSDHDDDSSIGESANEQHFPNKQKSDNEKIGSNAVTLNEEPKPTSTKQSSTTPNDVPESPAKSGFWKEASNSHGRPTGHHFDAETSRDTSEGSLGIDSHRAKEVPRTEKATRKKEKHTGKKDEEPKKETLARNLRSEKDVEQKKEQEEKRRKQRNAKEPPKSSEASRSRRKDEEEPRSERIEKERRESEKETRLKHLQEKQEKARRKHEASKERSIVGEKYTESEKSDVAPQASSSSRAPATLSVPSSRSDPLPSKTNASRSRTKDPTKQRLSPSLDVVPENKPLENLHRDHGDSRYQVFLLEEELRRLRGVAEDLVGNFRDALEDERHELEQDRRKVTRDLEDLECALQHEKAKVKNLSRKIKELNPDYPIDQDGSYIRESGDKSGGAVRQQGRSTRSANDSIVSELSRESIPRRRKASTGSGREPKAQPRRHRRNGKRNRAKKDGKGSILYRWVPDEWANFTAYVMGIDDRLTPRNL